LADLRESVWYQLWKSGQYRHQTQEDKFYIKFLRSGQCVWDVGANVGYTTRIFAAAVGRTGSVISLEPGRRTYRMLERTVRGIPQVRTIACAASFSDSQVQFLEEHYSDVSHVVSSGFGSYSVPSVALDSLLAREGRSPDLLKIDVEGFESEVLQGAQLLILKHQPLVVFEALSLTAFDSINNLLNRGGEVRYSFLRFYHDECALHGVSQAGLSPTNNYLAYTGEHRRRLLELFPHLSGVFGGTV
jgi:FkbM family methyltransferase